MLVLSAPAKAGVFYLIAFGLALVIAAFAGWLGEASLVITMLTPTVAAILMLAVVTPEGRSRAGWASLGLGTAGMRGWPFAILAPVIVLLATYSVLWASPLAAFKPLDPFSGAAAFALDIAAGSVISIGFAAFEEIGWRGYMLPKLAAIGVVPAMLLVGFLHGVWHLPLLLTTPFYHASGDPLITVPLFLITLTLAGVFYGYLRLSTGSVWPVAIAHGVFNQVWNLADRMSTTDAPTTMEYIGGESGILMIVCLAVIAGLLIPRTRRLGVG